MNLSTKLLKLKKGIGLFLLLCCSSLAMAQVSAFCETEVLHFAGDPPSAIDLTITNTGSNSMVIEIESADADPVDLLLINNGSGATFMPGNLNTTVVNGKITTTLSWGGTPPANVDLEILWSKVANPGGGAGQWLLQTFTVPFAATCPSTGPDLVLTAVYDATLPGGLPKGVELYVINDIPDLSAYGIGSANNGGGTDGEEFTFPAASATAGSYIYVASEATDFMNYFGFAPDYTDGAVNVNGDDAIELFMNGAVIDTYGDINVDGSGEPWEYMDGWAYRVDNTGPDGSTFVLANWTYSGANALDPCNGATNATCASMIPFGTYAAGASANCSELFFSEYVEGSSSDKAVEIYNPTGLNIDLGANNYVLSLFSNGSTTASQSLNLTGTIASGDVFVIANSGANAALLAVADLTNNSVINFNGDDAVVLTVGGPFGTGVVVDAIGQVGVDPGSEWSSGGVGTQNENLRRMTSIEMGDTDETDAFLPGDEWVSFDDADFSDFGMHSTACTAVPIPTVACFQDYGLFESFVVQNATGSTNVGEWNPTFENYQISGFNGGVSGNFEVYVVSPELSYTGVAALNLTFDIFEDFDDTDVEVVFSTDFTGDPATATWTNLATLDAPDQGAIDFTGSEVVDLLGVTDLSSFHVAFYYNDTDNYSRWRFSNIAIEADVCPCTIDGITTANISSCDNNGTDTDPTDDTFTVDVTVNFTMPATSGDLDIELFSGATSIGTASVDATTLVGNSFTFTGIVASSVGGNIAATAQFSDDQDCFVYLENLGMIPPSCSLTPCEELFFSEYIEGSGLNKCIEIFNPSAFPMDLGAMDVEVEIYFNGNVTPGTPIDLSAVIPAGGTYVICDDGADQNFLDLADLAAGGAFYNGNDAVVLTKGGVVIDAIGQIGNSSSFGANLTTLLRTDIEVGDNNAFDAFTFDPAEWIELPINSEDLGRHCSTCSIQNGNPCPAEATISDPCVCLDNATMDGNGQFGELIEVSAAPGGTWTVTASTGLFFADQGNPAQPAVAGTVYPLTPITGAALVEVAPGTYQLAGVHIDGIGYTVMVENLFTGEALTLAPPACNYPQLNPTGIEAINNVCEDDTNFDFAVNPTSGGNPVPGTLEAFINGVSLGTTSPYTIDISTLSVGQNIIQVNFDADDFMLPNPGCAISYEFILQVNEPAGTLACNDNVQISLAENCQVEITGDMILEGSYPNNDFEVEIMGVAGNILTAANVNNTYTVKVNDACGPNSCWGSVTVEDKLAPTLDCTEVTVSCAVAIADVPAPTGMDNCDGVLTIFPPNVQIHLIDQVLDDNTACDDGQVVYVQTYIATDSQGNTSAPCVRNVNVVRPPADMVSFPDDLVWSCEQYAAYDYIIDATPINPNISNMFGNSIGLFGSTAGWDLTDIPFSSTPNLLTQNVAGTDPLRATGSGIPDNIDGLYCEYGYTSADEVLSACGFPASTDSPVFKIVRTWTVLDWCTGQVVTGNVMGEDNIQVIKVVDDVPPVVSGVDVTINTNITGIHPQPCKANGFIPMGIATDNCTGVGNIEAYVYAQNPNLVPNITAIAAVDGNGMINPPLFIGSYFLVYQAEDECGNVAQSNAVNLTVEDGILPVAVCDEITDVNLSSDGLAVVYAETFDDGSYDNCCLDRFEVRRMNDACGVLGNTTFDNDGNANDNINDPDNGEFVTFCCEDIGNTVMVVLRVYDCSSVNANALGYVGTGNGTGNGNYNECMVEVKVSDKVGPSIVCPANDKISCDSYADILEAALIAANGDDVAESAALTAAGFGTFTAIDNCEPIVTPTVSISIDQCGVGSVVRSFSATDASDNGPANCTQVLTVYHISDFVVEFPADVNGLCDMAEPDFGEPEIFFETCELVATSFEDQIFDVVPDACFKITRQWTVINWCVVGDEIDEETVEQPEIELTSLPFAERDLDGDGDRDDRTFRDSWSNGVFPGRLASEYPAVSCNDLSPDTDDDVDSWDGYITYQQSIKIEDTEAPVIDPTFTVEDLCIIDGNDGTDDDFTDCVFSGVLPTPTYEDCILDVNGNLDANGELIENSIIVTAEVFDAAGNLVSNSVVLSELPIGMYTVRYLAIDRCGNSVTTEFDFEISDCKAPTAYCIQGLVVSIMAINDPNNTTFFPMIDVWAEDLNAGSFDNCPGDLSFSFSEDNTTDNQWIATCNGFFPDLSAADGAIGANPVTVYVTDADGNVGICETIIQVQDNQGNCDNGIPLIVGGNVATEDDVDVQDVEVSINGSGTTVTEMTNTDGDYSMTVPAGGDYTIAPKKDVDHNNGVSTFDLVKISKHILNVETLDSPYKMIAADANKSGGITTLDLVHIRKVILLIDDEFQNNTSWRFVDADYQFPNPSNPWAEYFPEIININDLSADALSEGFIAIKIGDVNGNASGNELLGADDRTGGTMNLAVENQQIKVGETTKVDFTASDFHALGMQFTLNFDQSALEFLGIENGLATEENFGFTLLEEGAITFSWNSNEAIRLTENEVLFTVEFAVTANTELSDVLSVDSKFTTAEAYNVEEEILDINLEFNGQATTGTFELFQNRPNPFNNATTIAFNLPEATMATLTITDLSGKVIRTFEGNYAKGYNEIDINYSDLAATGVLHYRLETAENAQTRKMVIIE